MKLRLAVPALLIVALAACGSSDDDRSGPGPTPPASSSSQGPSTAPSASADPAGDSPTSASDLIGTWSDDEAAWTVRFAKDGTFQMDYQGVSDFTSGTYTLEGDTVTLEGESTDVGRVDGSSLVFKLGTLVRG